MVKLLLIIPFLFLLAGIPFANKIHPMLLGMPFSLFWIAAGILLSTATLAVVYHFDRQNKGEEQ
ncbi:DUF3311 domain-containing protein [Listeria booriae]|uniref:DUF3311 domain-containing protein n=1 Tax=Listeria booriae TaxID=1552123 RepID=A0A842APH2_9LIST|nr:DUF3311 domain-containing protein [Listeria booriae]MBC1402750.1 DUF3311 domain-containing protein [Listeria booriae]MBC1617778.1 DUF3311 domain-containing protein [Listeria booriae]